jgi:hypothetical protein
MMITLHSHLYCSVITRVWCNNVVIFCDMVPCSLYVNRRFGGRYHFHPQSRKSAEQETSVQKVARQKMEVISSSETSVHIRTTRRYIPEDGNIHNYRCVYICFVSIYASVR